MCNLDADRGTFDVRKHLIKIQGGRDYLPVAYRLVWFRQEHPDWGIDTRPVLIDPDKGLAVFQATVTNPDGRLMASGTKMETARGFADYVEKAETGAIGRALGVLGYGTQFAPEFDEGDRLADSPMPPGGRPGRQDPPARTAPAAYQTGAMAAPGLTVGVGTCAECDRPLSRGQVDYSQARFGRPLCPQHQPRQAAGSDR